jgi:hypothetical protein
MDYSGLDFGKVQDEFVPLLTQALPDFLSFFSIIVALSFVMGIIESLTPPDKRL